MRLLLNIITFTISINSFAAHWATYYVYIETDYVQGTWTRTDLLDHSNYKYLTVEVYEDLFGSEEEEVARKFLSRLKDKKPELYNWPYDLSIQDGIVSISSKETPENVETIKNEITATMVFNNFKAVNFIFGEKSETLTKENLSLPYFDLISNQITQAPTLTETQDLIEQDQILESNKKPLNTWLVLSVILNLSLLGLLIRKSVKA